MDHWWADCVAVGPGGTSFRHSSQELDCGSRTVHVYTLDIRFLIFAIQDQWRGSESRWHYLRDRFTAALNYRAKLLYKFLINLAEILRSALEFLATYTITRDPGKDITEAKMVILSLSSLFGEDGRRAAGSMTPEAHSLRPTHIVTIWPF